MSVFSIFPTLPYTLLLPSNFALHYTYLLTPPYTLCYYLFPTPYSLISTPPLLYSALTSPLFPPTNLLYSLTRDAQSLETLNSHFYHGNEKCLLCSPVSFIFPKTWFFIFRNLSSHEIIRQYYCGRNKWWSDHSLVKFKSSNPVSRLNVIDRWRKAEWIRRCFCFPRICCLFHFCTRNAMMQENSASNYLNLVDPLLF